MSEPRISVIVAIYNAQKTIQRLTDSLKAQTMPDFEVLLIDDGSTDSTGSICDKIAEYDSRFKVFHKPNEGIGTTRQFGIEHASGEYTIHADADDWVEPDYLELLYKEAFSSGADMVICDIMFENGKKAKCQKQQPTSFDRNTLIHDLLCKLNNGPCNKLVRRAAYMDRDIRYPQDLNYGEDQLFNLNMLLAGITVSYVPKALYHYDIVSNPDSAARGGSLKKIQDRDSFINALKELLPQEYEKGIDNQALSNVYQAIVYKPFTRAQFNSKYSYLKRLKWKEYYKYQGLFSLKIIIWTSLHISYYLALFMYGVKRTKRRLKL